MNENDIYMIWLNSIEGMTIKRAYKLLSFFGNPLEIYKADYSILSSVKGIPSKLINQIYDSKDLDKIDDMLYSLEEKGIGYVSILNPLYPRLLKETYEPPLGIYYRGTLPLEKERCFSIIGARRCSEYGASVAEKFSSELSRLGFTIVSGMAKGIDTLAHRGSLSAGGRTIGVLGCGADICYPPENDRLMEEIIENGCIITEYPPSTPALAYNFPRRNRIISGISSGVLVVEAGRKSGTLITVDFALDSGRNVFTVPGNITSYLSDGTNDLIKSGCPIVTCVEDIILELGVIAEEKTKTIEKKVSDTLTVEEQQVLSLIRNSPKTLEDLIILLDKPIQNVQYILTYLEIYGYVKMLPGQRYIRTY